jgi:hypothetical protein
LEAEHARLQTEEEARNAAAIASATLRTAAHDALELLCSIGYINHVVARKLAAALAKGDQS